MKKHNKATTSIAVLIITALIALILLHHTTDAQLSGKLIYTEQQLTQGEEYTHVTFFDLQTHSNETTLGPVRQALFTGDVQLVDGSIDKQRKIFYAIGYKRLDGTLVTIATPYHGSSSSTTFKSCEYILKISPFNCLVFSQERNRFYSFNAEYDDSLGHVKEAFITEIDPYTCAVAKAVNIESQLNNAKYRLLQNGHRTCALVKRSMYVMATSTLGNNKQLYTLQVNIENFMLQQQQQPLATSVTVAAHKQTKITLNNQQIPGLLASSVNHQLKAVDTRRFSMMLLSLSVASQRAGADAGSMFYRYDFVTNMFEPLPSAVKTADMAQWDIHISSSGNIAIISHDMANRIVATPVSSVDGSFNTNWISPYTTRLGVNTLFSMQDKLFLVDEMSTLDTTLPSGLILVAAVVLAGVFVSVLAIALGMAVYLRYRSAVSQNQYARMESTNSNLPAL